MPIRKGDTDMLTLDDWLSMAGPKGREKQWVDGRSAKECARAWLEKRGEMPPEIARLLEQLGGGPLRIERAEPEALLAFDGRGGPRNADMAVWAADDTGPVALTIEAKADEPFDELLAGVLISALERQLETTESGALARAIDLARSLFPPRQPKQPRLDQIRYQLMTAAAGTLAMAHRHGANRAVLVIHEFRSAETSWAKLNANAEDLDTFVRRLSGGTVNKVASDVLYGPFVVPGGPLFSPPAALYVGKVVRTLGEPKP